MIDLGASPESRNAGIRIVDLPRPGHPMTVARKGRSRLACLVPRGPMSSIGVADPGEQHIPRCIFAVAETDSHVETGELRSESISAPPSNG